MNVRPITAFCASALTLALMAPGPPASTTKVVIFAPWSPTGLRHGFAISARLKGTCWTRSLATNRTDAWRCMAGNDIYDPCFAGSPQKGVVACAELPFSKTVVLLRDNKPLGGKPYGPTHAMLAKGQPWALRLRDGDTCVYETGATDVIAGKRMNYACTKSGWIVGFVNRSAKTWTAQSVASPSDKRLRTVAVASAVF